MSPHLIRSLAARPPYARLVRSVIVTGVVVWCGVARAGGDAAPAPIANVPASAQVQAVDPFDDALRRIEKIRGLAPRLEAWVVRRAERMV